MTGPSQPNALRRMGWPLRLVFLVSLGLNLLVAGVVAGHLISGPPDRPPRVDRMAGPLTFALDEEDRRAIGRDLRRAYRAERPSHDRIAEEYRGVVAALRSDPFDAGAVEAALQNQIKSATRRITLGQEMLMDRIAGMSAADRSAFADRLEEGLTRMEQHRAKWEAERGDTRSDE